MMQKHAAVAEPDVAVQVGAVAHAGGAARIVAIVLLVLAAVTGARAAVTLEQAITMKGLPMVGDVSSSVVTRVSGDVERTESKAEFQGALAKMMGGGGENVQITRLDRELIWSLDPKERTYTEMTFADMRRMMEDLSGKMKAMTGGSDAPEGEFQLDVKRTGEEKTVAGRACKQVIITMTGQTRDPESGTALRSRWTMDLWLARAEGDLAELESFTQRLGEKMGLSTEIAGGLSQFLGAHEEALEKLAAEMKKAGGYPLESRITMETEAPPEGEPAAGAPPDESEGESAGAEAQAMQKALGMLARMRGGSGEPAKPSADGFAQVLSIETRTVKIGSEAAPAGSFEIPEGYKQVKAPMLDSE